MPFDSAADLLFRITGDSSQGQAELAAFRASVAANFGEVVASSKAANTAILYDWAGNPIRRIGDDFAAVADTTVNAGRRMVSSHRESREALRGLGEEIGVHMPRFVSSWLSSLGGVSTVMAAAFAPIAAIGLVEVLAKIPTALEKGIDWLHGWTAESKKAFEQSTKDALEFQQRSIRLTERLRAITLIGKEGMEKYHLEAVINSEDIHTVSSKIDELNAKIVKLKEIANIKPLDFVAPMKTAAQELASIDLTGGGTGTKFKPAVFGPSKEDIEKAKLELKALEPIVKTLTEQLDDLSIKAREIPAEAAAAAAKKSEKSLQDFTDLTRILDQVQSKLAATGSAEDKVRAEMAKLDDEAGQAHAKLEALIAAHRVSPETSASQMAAWEYVTRMIPELQGRMFKEIDAKRTAEIDRQNAEISSKWLLGFIAGVKKEGEALDSLRARLAKFHAETLDGKHRAWDAEIDLDRQKLDEENKARGGATAEMLADLAKFRAEGHAKIDADAKSAAGTELAQLGEQLQRIERSHQTTEQRIADQYLADVAKFATAEEKKALIGVKGEEARAAIAAKFAAIRKALYIKEEQDLQALHNSTGWKGVFGADFAKAIRGNEDLSEDWADAEKRSHLLVKVAMEATKEQSMDLFSGMTQGMGSAIAQALVYSKSIGDAMRQTAASTLESIAAKDIVLAMDSLGWGFYDIAMHDYPGAAAAFEAAAIFGSVGLAAGLAGRAIAGPQSSSAAGTGAGSALPSDTAARQANMQAGGVGAPAGQGGTHVTVNVYGHVYGSGGIQELASAINDAVLNLDVTLTATNTTTGVQVRR